MHMHRQSLFDNEQQVQDHFAMFWEQVAMRFKANPYVLGRHLPPHTIFIYPGVLTSNLFVFHSLLFHTGYELLNEPWAGDIYRHLDQLEPRMLFMSSYSLPPILMLTFSHSVMFPCPPTLTHQCFHSRYCRPEKPDAHVPKTSLQHPQV